MAPGRTGMEKRMRTVSVFRSPATSWVTCYVWGWGCPREAPGPLHTPALSWPTMHHIQLLATVAVTKLGFSVHMSMCGVCVWGASARSYWGHPWLRATSELLGCQLQHPRRCISIPGGAFSAVSSRQYRPCLQMSAQPFPKGPGRACGASVFMMSLVLPLQACGTPAHQADSYPAIKP